MIRCNLVGCNNYLYFSVLRNQRRLLGAPGKPKVQDKVIPVLVSSHTKEYEESNENKCRSLRIFYKNGLMANEKYKSVCRNIKTNVDKSLPNPKLVYYDKLIAFIKSEDIRNVHDFASEFCTADKVEFEEPVHGSLRDFL